MISKTRRDSTARGNVKGAQWSNRYEGRFDAGWDTLREEIFARQKQLGIMPQDAELTARNDTRPMVPICRVPVSPETTTRPGGRRRL